MERFHLVANTCVPHVCICVSANRTVSEVKVRQIPPKPLKETARKMRPDNTDETNKGHIKG